MPIYEFLCKKCRKQFEALVSIGREKDISCKNCGNGNLEKLVSSFGIGGGNSKLKSASNGCSTCSSTSCNTCK